jgi:hypothetical protein
MAAAKHSAAIVDVLNRYGAAMDSRDWISLRSCFEPDAQLSYDTSGSYDGVEAFIRHLDEALPAYGATNHIVTNHQVRWTGRREAHATSYALAQHITSNGKDTHGTGFLLAGVYHDLLRRRSGRWCIARREFRTTWTSIMSVSLPSESPGGLSPRAAREAGCG